MHPVKSQQTDFPLYVQNVRSICVVFSRLFGQGIKGYQRDKYEEILMCKLHRIMRAFIHQTSENNEGSPRSFGSAGSIASEGDSPAV